MNKRNFADVYGVMPDPLHPTHSALAMMLQHWEGMDELVQQLQKTVTKLTSKPQQQIRDAGEALERAVHFMMNRLEPLDLDNGESLLVIVEYANEEEEYGELQIFKHKPNNRMTASWSTKACKSRIYFELDGRQCTDEMDNFPFTAEWAGEEDFMQLGFPSLRTGKHGLVPRCVGYRAILDYDESPKTSWLWSADLSETKAPV
jgi:hypothetical protein